MAGGLWGIGEVIGWKYRVYNPLGVSVSITGSADAVRKAHCTSKIVLISLPRDRPVSDIRCGSLAVRERYVVGGVAGDAVICMSLYVVGC